MTQIITYLLLPEGEGAPSVLKKRVGRMRGNESKMGVLDEHIDFARKLRRNQTAAEDLFWAKVRNRRFHNYKFRRQVPTDKYFADFLCESKKLVVELDDISHADREGYDAHRTAILNNLGYRVIRFTNAGVYDDLDGVMEHLYSVLKDEV